MQELRKNEMYRPLYPPLRLQHVDSYAARRGQIYVIFVLFVTILATALLIRQFGTLPVSSNKRTITARKNMQKCEQYYGKVSIFVAESAALNTNNLTRDSLDCYVKGANYSLIRVNIDNDPRVNEVCSKHKTALFKRHCAASVYLQDTDWMLFVDTQAGVVNPEHCIEEWIDDRVDMIFFERFFNWEIAAGSYLVKNTALTRNFLRQVAKWEFKEMPIWNNQDQGAFMLQLQRTLSPAAKWELRACHKYWQTATSYQTYTAMITCVRSALGARKLWTRKARIYRKAHAWIRDASISRNSWSNNDFMLQGWKDDLSNKDCPFESSFKIKECGATLKGWNWRRQKKIELESLKEILQGAEEYYRKEFPSEGRVIPNLDLPIVASCFPHCEK
ncbi:unnamed protein product [Cylicocyclus nassatus]|uniref:Uncharacterized protein n=1 Tax=Cylicocyclus nassatus TaxID=53992 RepID=A0AA36H6Y8_CYLNA|nr:unnamed protein product [Cylicocyclus nassatus]